MSLALGAFFAGMIFGESRAEARRAGRKSLPLRDAFAVLFFVSVGMLFNPRAVMVAGRPRRSSPPCLGSSWSARPSQPYCRGAPVRLCQLGTSLTISASLAQIGEFSFILAVMGVSMKLLPPEGQNYIVAGALLSIVLNPLAFGVVGRLAGARPASPQPH